MESLHAFQVTQKGESTGSEPISIFITAMTFGQLRKYVDVDRWSPDNPKGYQRPPVDRRLREVARYMLEEQGILPTSILLSTRPKNDDSGLDFHPEEGGSGSVTWGTLSIPDNVKLWIVDGQHRYFGIERAYERTGAMGLESYPFPVCIMDKVEWYLEMVHFNIINTRQKKMPTDIVDRHLLMRQQTEGIKMMTSGKRGAKEYQQATATRIVDLLNEEEGPWYHQIAVPGVPGRDQGLVRQHAMVASLDPVMRDNWIRGQVNKPEGVVKVLSNYWEALQEIWPHAFESPDEYRVQATVGIYSLHMVLPVLIQKCLAERDLSKDKMREMMKATEIDATFWHKENGDPLTLGTGMASIRAVAQHIIGQLPQISADAVRL